MARQASRISWLLLCSAILIVLPGCASMFGSTNRIVLIPPGEPVQLAEDTQAYIYVDGEKSVERVTIPHGWWALPDPE